MNKATPLEGAAALAHALGLDGGGPDPPPPPPPHAFLSAALRAACPPPPRVTQPRMLRFLYGWADSVNYFLELVSESPPPAPGAAPRRLATLTVRFDAVAWQRPAPKLAALEAVLRFAGVEPTEAMLERVRPALGADSQDAKPGESAARASGSGGGSFKVLTPSDVAACRAFIAATPVGSSDCVLPPGSFPSP